MLFGHFMMPKLTSLYYVIHHPMMKSLMNFTFPEMSDEEWKERLAKTHSIRDFQCNFIYHTLLKVLEKVLMV
jgi:hypothetical protein